MSSFWRVCVVCGRRWWVKWPQRDCPAQHRLNRDLLQWLQEQFELRAEAGSYARGQRMILRMVARRLEGLHD